MKKRTPVIMNMSGIYREEKFWKGQETVWVEAEDIPVRTVIVMKTQELRSVVA